MAAKKPQMFMIHDGPGAMEMQFSEYSPSGHIVEFAVEETDGAAVSGQIFGIIGDRRTLHCQVLGSDRVERRMKDVLGRELPPGARRIRLRQGTWPFEGWYDPHKRKGFLRESQGFRNGVPPRDYLRKLRRVPVI
jgi:hypothetical protein